MGKTPEGEEAETITPEKTKSRIGDMNVHGKTCKHNGNKHNGNDVEKQNDLVRFSTFLTCHSHMLSKFSYVNHRRELCVIIVLI